VRPIIDEIISNQLEQLNVERIPLRERSAERAGSITRAENLYSAR
jgi:hypothetical protein